MPRVPSTSPSRASILALALTLPLAGCSGSTMPPGSGTGSGLGASSASVSARRHAPAHHKGKGLTVLYSFAGGSDAGYPWYGVTVDAAGNVFGTTPSGGASGDGAVYALRRASGGYAESVVHSFDGADGMKPYVTPFEDENGNVFASASAGGTNYGTTLELTPSSSGYATKNVFPFDNSDGAYPNGSYAKLGKTLYAVAQSGGANRYGAIVAIADGGATVTDVYDFKGGTSDGINPSAGLTARDGVLYGTTTEGGAYQYGTIFSFVPARRGGSESVLYSFRGGNDGAYPYGAVAIDAAGNLYATTNNGGGRSVNGGTVVKLTPGSSGYTETVLHTFTDSPDGVFAFAGVALHGTTLYGTTTNGGQYGFGTIYQIGTDGSNYAVDYDFGYDSSNGTAPYGQLTFRNGLLFGTTYKGGQHNAGTVFTYAP
jgi:uncharacterized repeat protein (TIGR03803 family)